MPSRYPSYLSSTTSHAPRPLSRQPTQTSTVPIPNALYNAYTTNTPYSLESSTSLVVNTWQTAVAQPHGGLQGGTVDKELAHKAWEHARRRVEDSCVILGCLHASTPSLFGPFLSTVPFTIPDIFYTALAAIRPFVSCVTPRNSSTLRYSALCAAFTVSVNTGELVEATIKLSEQGLDIPQGLQNICSEPGNRAFDVFYYMLSSVPTPAEREALGLRPPSSYTLLQKSKTYTSPDYLPTADDTAAAEDFRGHLKAIGISGKDRRGLLATLAAILRIGDASAYLVNNVDQEDIFEEVAALLNFDPQVLNLIDHELLVGGLYSSLADWVLDKANTAIAKHLSQTRNILSSHDDEWSSGATTPQTLPADGVTVTFTVVDVPGTELGRAIALQNVFEESAINAEMREDGVPIPRASTSTTAETKTAVSNAGLDMQQDLTSTPYTTAFDTLHRATDEGSFVRALVDISTRQSVTSSNPTRFDLKNLILGSRVWFHLCVHPSDVLPADLAVSPHTWSSSSVSTQIRSWALYEWANRRTKHLNFTSDFELDEFCSRYAKLGCKDGRDGIESFLAGRGWSNGQVYIGKERVWMRESAWWEAESMLDILSTQEAMTDSTMELPLQDTHYHDANDHYFDSSLVDPMDASESRYHLPLKSQSAQNLGRRSMLATKSIAPPTAHTYLSTHPGDYGLGTKGDELKGILNDLDPEIGNPKLITMQPTTQTRKIWTTIVWGLTFWIPSPFLRYVGGMKRPDVRMAWREKVIIVLIIFLLNAAVVFYIVEFGKLLCPSFDKVWNIKEVTEHTATNDIYVTVRGRVYDITKFAKIQHSSITGVQVTDSAMQSLAGLDLDEMFPVPLYVGCSGLVSNTGISLLSNTSNSDLLSSTTFTHTFGALSPYSDSTLADKNWYWDTFLPKMKDYYKGELVTSTKTVASEGSEGSSDAAQMVIINNNVYDLSDYIYTLTYESGNGLYSFLSDDVYNMIQQNIGQDITPLWNAYALTNTTDAALNLNCLNNVFYIGKTDFRQTSRCQVNNYILLGFTIILCAVILVKFLAALQFGGKKHPAPQDRFVLMQIPCYTESEDHLRKSIDSLTNMNYDNKRKLICVICDGVVVGGGNSRPTPKIVLDLLGVDPKIDPPALPFKSVGQGSEQLNYGKVYSGLYESDGNVVPYLVVVKVGKDSEQTGAKPGNRGKRDSQILLLNFLNCVHHQKPMSPLELEMYHQIRNVIGVAPELYEYLFMVDADTNCESDSLNHLVASCTNDAKIVGICGETSLENEGQSLITMMQVYEYYISHHLAKAFESLFGSVTCLPGCFSMYRLRNDRGKPLIISDDIITEYGDGNINTLHKKNLLHLGEDRYLTTLMTKHFPNMSFRFNRDAHAHTAAPESFSILLSQRRRWQNSTVHNLMELFLLKDMCGFCCFSMRFVVLIDLFGTIILPATCVYLAYLIYTASSGGPIPLISLIMLACVYGLQAIIFILRRKWEMIGWLVFYLLAFPIYSFVLPIYSFWQMDTFSWGNTRVVIGEKGGKQVVAVADEPFDPRSIPLQFWDDYASANGLPGRYSDNVEKFYDAPAYDENGYEMDDLRSVYTTGRPASTVLTGLNGNGLYLPPSSRAQTPALPPQYPHDFRPLMQQRHSTYSHLSRYTDASTTPLDHPLTQHPTSSTQALLHSTANHSRQPSHQHQDQPHRHSTSTDKLLSATPSPALSPSPSRPLLSSSTSRPSSAAALTTPPNFQHGRVEPSDAEITEAIRACLAMVDLETVTKKQLKGVVERRLGRRLGPERREWVDKEIDVELEKM